MSSTWWWKTFLLNAYSLCSILQCHIILYQDLLSVQKVLPEHELFFEVTNTAFSCSLLHCEVCFSHPIHPEGYKFSCQQYCTISLSPTIPLSHQPPLAYLFLLPAPAYLVSPVQPPIVILATPSAAILLKSALFHWCSPVLQSICLALSPLPATSLPHAWLLPNAFRTDRINDGMKTAKAPNSLSLFSPTVFKGKSCKHNFKDWMWLELHWKGQSVPAHKVVGRESKQKQIVYL